MNLKFLVLFFFFSFSGNALVAQGTISGTILDGSFGDGLMGANILVKELGTGEQADMDGKYQIKVDAGTYTLEISYVGYTSKTFEDIIVKDNEVTYVDATLSEGVEMEEIVVVDKAKRSGENALLVAMLKGDRVADGISIQEMRKLNISDAAQAMSKVTGVTVMDNGVVVRGLGDRYSTAQINGATLPGADPYKNSVNLDLIPANLLDNIVTSKTFTPDLPGNFTGGNVNLETKDLPEEFSLTISASTAYNSQGSMKDNFLTQDGGSNDWLGYDDGYRALNNDLTLEGNQQFLAKQSNVIAKFDDEAAGKLEGFSNELLTNMSPTSKQSPMDHSLSLSLTKQIETGSQSAIGIIFNAGYNRQFRSFNNGINGNYTLESPTASMLNSNFNLSQHRSVESPTTNGMLGLSYKFNKNNNISYTSIYNHSTDIISQSLNGEHLVYDVRGDETFTSNTQHFRERSIFQNQLKGQHAFGEKKIRVNWIGSYNQGQQYEPELRFFAYEYDAGFDEFQINAPSEYTFPSHLFRDLTDNQFEGKVDVIIPFTKKIKVKVGGLVSQKNREFSEFSYSIQDGSGAIDFNGNDAEFFGSENSGWLGLDNNKNLIGNFVINNTDESNQYTGQESIGAGYAMATIQATPKIKVIAGARYENTELSTTYKDDGEEKTSSTSLGKVLPSVNLVYGIAEKMNLRASYSNTVARPNLRELAPFSNIDFIGSAFITGNPDLEVTEIINADLRWEWLPKGGELIALGAYYKDFTNPIILVDQLKANPEFQYENVDHASLYGVELEVRKNLDFISPVLNNFKWSNNFSLIHSKVDINAEELAIIEEYNPEAGSFRPFFGQSPFIINSNLTFSEPEKNIDASLSFNVFGKRLVVVGQEGTPDVYEKARPQLDFTIGKRLENGMALRLSAKNLLDASFQTSSTFKGQEYVYSKYKLGRTISLGFSYTIK